mmetsp:Transcript_73285/g.174629  ORF Transcript_73285/g.174629 Transcript_73285/m.174629 type:complete len:210 (+) Transcript_73285:1623-2252(+)
MRDRSRHQRWTALRWDRRHATALWWHVNLDMDIGRPYRRRVSRLRRHELRLLRYIPYSWRHHDRSFRRDRSPGRSRSGRTCLGFILRNSSCGLEGHRADRTHALLLPLLLSVLLRQCLCKCLPQVLGVDGTRTGHRRRVERCRRNDLWQRRQLWPVNPVALLALSVLGCAGSHGSAKRDLASWHSISLLPRLRKGSIEHMLHRPIVSTC